jgi:signal transduction histidine kinase
MSTAGAVTLDRMTDPDSSTMSPVATASWFPVGLVGLPAVAIAVYGIVAASRDEVRAADVVRAVLVVAWAIAGTLALRRPGVRRLGKLVLIGAVLGAVAFAGARVGDIRSGEVGTAGRFVATLACPLLMALSGHALLALPNGLLTTRARRTTAIVGYALAVIAAVALWAGPGHVSVGVGAIGWVLAVAATLPSAHRQYLLSAGVDRQRLQWLGCGAVIAGEIALVAAALNVFLGWPAHVGATAAAATVLLPAGFAASTSERLVARVDRALVHTVSITGLTAVVIAVYLLIVVGLGTTPSDADRQVLGLSMVAAAIAAIAYVPARTRLGDVANRLVYGEREAPDEVLRTFGSRLTRAIPMDELLLQLVESLRKTMGLGRAEIWTGGADVLERSAAVPDRGPATLAIGERERQIVARAGVSGNAWANVWLPALLTHHGDAQLRVAPITHSGELLGLIVVDRGADRDAFSEDEDRVLTELARQAGLALHNVQLDSALQATLDEVRRQAEELRASRSRIVATADAERRKIERNLHDGAQQHLVALAVNLRLVKDMLADDPDGANEMLDALAADVKSTIQELRDLAHGIYPPLLLDSGLAEALRAAAGRSPLDVAVIADDIGRYPSEVEAAVYFCCLEALQNAAKHADGATVAVHLREDAGGLLFDVADSGPGFDVAVATQGHGFLNMSDRVGAIGGTVRWESTPGGGATVAGSIPLT